MISPTSSSTSLLLLSIIVGNSDWNKNTLGTSADVENI